MRCKLVGTDLGDLIGTELTIVGDEVHGQAYIYNHADAVRLVAIVNAQEEGRISLKGTDCGDLMGTPLYDICLDDCSIGWAQAGWLNVA